MWAGAQRSSLRPTSLAATSNLHCTAERKRRPKAGTTGRGTVHVRVHSQSAGDLLTQPQCLHVLLSVLLLVSCTQSIHPSQMRDAALTRSNGDAQAEQADAAQPEAPDSGARESSTSGMADAETASIPDANAQRNGPEASAGCGSPAAGGEGYVRHVLELEDLEREYFLWLPADYDPDHPYPLIFRWHGAGGNGVSGGLEIEEFAGQEAIIVSPSGRDGRWSLRADGPDVALFDVLLEQLSGRLCVDRARVFSYGFSAGGTLTHLLACVRGAQLRGVATVAGGPRGEQCQTPMAAWLAHGSEDTVVPPSLGEALRDHYQALNHCSTTASPTAPAPCIRYADCDSEVPLVYCETDARHNPQGALSAPAAWNFFQDLR